MHEDYRSFACRRRAGNLPVMDAPIDPPCEDNLSRWEAYALAYLQPHFRTAAPSTLSHATVFPNSPLEGEGATIVFEFFADRTGQGRERYFVVVGETEANYYPAYDLDRSEGLDLHLGTRFMLVMGVAQISQEQDDLVSPNAYHAMEDARRIVDRIAPNAKIEDLLIAAMFDVAGARHAVLRCRIDGEPVYVMGCDAPPGFSRRVDLPPQVAYRLHLGRVLRSEPVPREAKP
ncbi:MAG: hypothetical protein ACE5EC_00465 [Phycisphaerae bacterium]